MLNKIIIHHKNIIFFKLVISTFLIIVLIAIIPTLEENYENEKTILKKSKASLSSTVKKLKSLDQFDDNEYVLYSQISTANSLLTRGCENKINLVRSIKDLSKKYDFLDMVDITTLPIIDIDYHINIPLNFNLISYEMSVMFDINQINDYFDVIEDLKKLLPINSIINEMNLTYDPAITPKLIHRLKSGKRPGAYKVVIKILIREITNAK